MEFLQTLLAFAPVTTAILIIMVTLVVISLISIVFLKGINFTLNSESWGKEIIPCLLLIEKIDKLLYKKSFTIKTKYAGYTYELISTGFSYVFYDSIDYLKDGVSGTGLGYGRNITEAKKFKTKEKAIQWLESKGKDYSKHDTMVFRFSKKQLLLIPLTDLCLYTFTLAPLLTIVTVSTAVLIMSVRWVSGKLANNVKNTDNNTKRINDIEEKLKDE